MKAMLAMLAVAALAMWGLKRYYADAPVDDIRWMLAPAAGVVSAVTGVAFEPEPGTGYVSRVRRFAIAKACAGINFMIAAFGMVAWILRRRARSASEAALVLAVSLLASYAAAIVVNAGRIVAALWLIHHPVRGMTDGQLHRIEGIACYFAGLVVTAELVRRGDAAVPPRAFLRGRTA